MSKSYGHLKSDNLLPRTFKEERAQQRLHDARYLEEMRRRLDKSNDDYELRLKEYLKLKGELA